MDESNEYRYQLLVICPNAIKRGGKGEFKTEERYSVAEAADPDFRLPCQRCDERHVLISVPQSLTVMTSQLRPEFGLLAAFYREDPSVPSVNVEEVLPERELIPEHPGTIHSEGPQVGRNDPCPCGSGKKFKKCHGGPGADPPA